ncbi:uncharacterized protein LOC129594723 [Paramacrobiotus metropolitanus]|uniref:uncharacterized protein LOC129594723 n=1 Tax=Paramacrobiotus metropolitanus TaxID=2943436 RepID=UPI00244655F6|nr:uncharacterized protein LOC129594723 [Paramacrobiotus metropolitanus]
MDRVMYCFCAYCNLLWLLFRTVSAAYVHIKAHSVTVILNTILEETDRCDVALEMQIRGTLRRLRDCPVVFTAWNIFTMNVEFIVSMFGILVTYILFIYETNPKDGRHTPVLLNSSARFS